MVRPRGNRRNRLAMSGGEPLATKLTPSYQTEGAVCETDITSLRVTLSERRLLVTEAILPVEGTCDRGRRRRRGG